jgi:hypothetical protein
VSTHENLKIHGFVILEQLSVKELKFWQLSNNSQTTHGQKISRPRRPGLDPGQTRPGQVEKFFAQPESRNFLNFFPNRSQGQGSSSDPHPAPVTRSAKWGHSRQATFTASDIHRGGDCLAASVRRLPTATAADP